MLKHKRHNQLVALEVNAKVDPGCFLEAENVNFGVLPMPLNNTSAQSKITVKCSRNTQLNISIDGMFASEIDYTKLKSHYQSQLQNNELTLEYRGYSSQTKIHTYFIGRWSTAGVGDFTCRSDGGGTTIEPTSLMYQFFTAGVVACNNDGTLVNFNGTPTTDMKISLLDHATRGSGKKTLNGLSHGESIKYTGLLLSLCGVLIFAVSMITMKNSWRVGIDKETKTEFVKHGIYKYSRNPAFVGFDMMFIGLFFTYSNLIVLVVVIVNIIGLDLLIRKEEEHLNEIFGEKYKEYKKEVGRYIGFSLKKVKL